MHSLAVYVEKELSFAQNLPLEISVDSYLYVFDWIYYTQCLNSFSSIDHLLRLYAWFLILFYLTFLPYVRQSWITQMIFTNSL